MARLHVRHLVRSDGFAGVERYLTYLGPELVGRGHQVSVVGGAPAAMREALRGSGVTWVPARTVAEVVRAAMAAPTPDLLHAHMTAAELAAALAALRIRRPVVATLHFGGGRGHSPATRRAYALIAARLDAELAVSRFVADTAGPGVRVLPLGLPAPETAPTDRSVTAASGPGVVLVGQRLEPEKETDIALRAWVASGLGARGWELRIAGQGSQEAELRRLAADLDPSGSIRFVGQRPDLGSDLAEASVLLAPRRDEAFGLTVVEAMARGVPVVAAGGGAHLETVGPAGPDLLFPPGDATGASDRLLRLADDPEARAAAGRDLQARYEAEYRIERHVDRLEAVYAEVLGRRAVTRAHAGRPVEGPVADDDGRRSVAFVFPGCHREGGVERVVRELARRVARTHAVTFVGDRFDAEGMDGVAFRPVDGRAVPGLPAAVDFRRRAQAALDGNGFEITVGFGVECPPGDIAVVGSVHRAWLARSGPIPTPVGALPARARFALPRHVALLALERNYFSSPRLRAVLAASTQTAAEVSDTYAVPQARVEVMPNGFDPDEFNLGVRTAHRDAQRARLGATDDVVILFVANELHRKGFATLLEAVAQVGDPRLRIDLVGRADPVGYAGRAADLGLTDRVRWHGPQAEVAPWYAGADLLVLPTTYEPFGNVVVEALACGLPVIVSRSAGSSAAVQPDVNGLQLQDPTRAGELAGLIRTALEPGRLDRWSRDATTGIDRYDWDRVASQFVETIDRIADQVPTPRPRGGPAAR